MEQRKQKKILIVDDSEVILKTLSLKLEADGYEVLTAQDGSQALSAARSQNLDLILLDISFPPDVASGGGVPWDGFRIIDWFRRMDEAREVPILIITAGPAEQYRDRAFKAGAVGFFHKPIDADELLAAVHKLLDKSPQATGPSALSPSS